MYVLQGGGGGIAHSRPHILAYISSLFKPPFTTIHAHTHTHTHTHTPRRVATSSMFLSTYCTVGVISVVMLRRLGLRRSTAGALAPFSVAGAGAIAGWTVLMEKKSRRVELGLFVWAKACDIFWQLAENSNLPILSKILTGLPGQLLLFMAGWASMMHAFVRHPTMIRPTYLSLLRRFVDSDSRHQFL